LEIAERLRRFEAPPKGEEDWWTSSFDVVLVGSYFQVWHRRFGPQLLKPRTVAALEPLFRKDRERRARLHPERGLWFYSWVTVSTTGGASLCSDFFQEPKVFDRTPAIPVGEYEVDLTAFPRSPFWMPKWLQKRLQKQRAK
jgi:hypothetical protein